ncbi:MAG: phosphatase PAP2 family protein [Thalassobaculum sp.]
MRLKHSMACRRPVELSPQINPMIPTPGHGALPSGHATEAFMVAHILAELSKDLEAAVYDQENGAANATSGASSRPKRIWRHQLMRQAARISTNRVIAGVHFPVDGVAGQVLGTAIAEYFLVRACGTGEWFTGWKFVGDAFGDRDHDWVEIDRILTGEAVQTDYLSKRKRCHIPADDLGRGETIPGPMNWLWKKAKEEWVV